jgi:protein gp37
MKPAWARTLREQCEADDIPFFFKQWGEWVPTEESQLSDDEQQVDLIRVGKKVAGRIFEGKTWDGLPLKSQIGVDSSADVRPARPDRCGTAEEPYASHI